MATIVTGIKVNDVVDAFNSAASVGTSTIYTAPANGYAIVQVTLTVPATTVGEIRVDNINIAPQLSGAAQQFIYSVYLGPGAVLGVTKVSGSGGVDGYARGVEFINS